MSEGLVEGLRRLHRLLAALGRPAAVIGGIALIARVGTRATRDVDVLLAAGPGDLDGLLQCCAACGYGFDPAERELFAEGLVRLWPRDEGRGGFGADLIFADAPYLVRVIARATPVDLAGVSLPVAAAEDLVLLKLEAGRPVDIDDVLAIKDALPELDLALVRDEAMALGLREPVELYFGPEPGGGEG